MYIVEENDENRFSASRQVRYFDPSTFDLNPHVEDRSLHISHNCEVLSADNGDANDKEKRSPTSSRTSE